MNPAMYESPSAVASASPAVPSFLRRALAAAGAGLLALALTSTTAWAQGVFRVTTIPEEAASEQLRKFAPLVKYLERQLGMKVEFTPVTDYPAAVEALVNRQVDLVWFGGFTFVQAKIRSGDKVIPIAQREEDAQFRSVFITLAGSGIKSLADLKGRNVSFGSQSSTSGHLMPRNFLLEAGINPEKDFKRVAYSGAHDATIASVVTGRVDAAALDITVWRKFVEEKKVDLSKVEVFYTTPPYFNYNWSVHADMPAAQRERITKALLGLSAGTPEGKEILGLARATRFIPTQASNYKGLEQAGRSAGLIK
ncbi:MAG: putative selenate ABC transporter substrate-binding protein [Betaproteobacteria bacterium]|jgi:phosphonate transport system substrate-binding protein|nr:putative selenate ABC transporter substrate-binding protein [Betaproteobacteria bacterium]